MKARYDHVHLTVRPDVQLPDIFTNSINFDIKKVSNVTVLSFFVGENNTAALQYLEQNMKQNFIKAWNKLFPTKPINDSINEIEIDRLLGESPQLYLLMFSTWVNHLELHRAFVNDENQTESEILFFSLDSSNRLKQAHFLQTFIPKAQDLRSGIVFRQDVSKLFVNPTHSYHQLNLGTNLQQENYIRIETDATYSLDLLSVKDIENCPLVQNGLIHKRNEAKHYSIEFSPDLDHHIFEYIAENLSQFISDEEWKAIKQKWKEDGLSMNPEKSAEFFYELLTHNSHLWAWLLSKWVKSMNLTITDFCLNDHDYKTCKVLMWHIKVADKTSKILRFDKALTNNHFKACL